MYTLLHLAVLTGVVLALARFLPGVHVRSTGSAVVVAVVFSLLNWALGWLIKAVLFLPAILTLGLLFLVIPFIVNTAILWITDKVLHRFELTGWRPLLLSAGAITVANAAFAMLIR